MAVAVGFYLLEKRQSKELDSLISIFEDMGQKSGEEKF